MKRSSVKSIIPLFRPADGVLVVLIGIVVFAGFRPERSGLKGNRIRVSVDGSLRMTHPLEMDTVLTVKGIIGDTEVGVSNGGTHIVRSPCPGKNCMHQGEIRNAGRMLICIPNRVTVTVEGGGEDGQKVDGLTP